MAVTIVEAMKNLANKGIFEIYFDAVLNIPELFLSRLFRVYSALITPFKRDRVFNTVLNGIKF